MAKEKRKTGTYYQPTTKSRRHEKTFLSKGLKDFTYTCSIIREEHSNSTK